MFDTATCGKLTACGCSNTSWPRGRKTAGCFVECMCQYSGQSQNYPLPCIEDMYFSLAGTTVYSKPDLTNVYLQLELEEEGSMSP